MVPEPLHARSGQQIAVGVVTIRDSCEIAVGDRVNKKLVYERRSPSFAGHLTDDGSEVPTRAVPAYRYSCRIDAEDPGVLGHPRGRAEAIIGGRWIFRFRRKAIIDRDDDATACVCQQAARGVGSFQVTQYPASAVEPHKRRERSRPLWRVHAHRELPCEAGNRKVLDLPHRLQRDGHAHFKKTVACLLGRDALEVQAARRIEHVDDRLGMRMDWHWLAPCCLWRSYETSVPSTRSMCSSEPWGIPILGRSTPSWRRSSMPSATVSRSP